MKLLSFLENQNLFTKEECSFIDSAFEKQKIPKGTVIQKLNEFSDNLYFLESGLIRAYYYLDGKDISHFFIDENFFVAPINSLFYNKSEPYEWEAIEPCAVRVIRYEKFLELENEYPRLARMLLDFCVMMLDLLSQKLNLIKFQKAHDRYAIFLEMYPNLANRVALGDIASFLGVTQQTLSVIRSKKA